jgi:hypothetical protein
MAEFRLSIDLSPVMAAAGNIINEQVLPLLSQAVRAVAQQVQTNWIESVQRARLRRGEKDAYAATIAWRSTGPFSALVQSDYQYDQEIENGRPARDLKRYLDTSAKVRRSAEGRRYLIIPFRHNTPGNEALGRSMPADVYEIARQLTPSRVTGQTTRVSGLIASDVSTRKLLTVNQNRYKWGAAMPASATWARPRYAQMYRFDTTTPGSGKSSSSYLTFRVMREGSGGWIIPPQPGQKLAEMVVNDMRLLAEKVFTEALLRSL